MIEKNTKSQEEKTTYPPLRNQADAVRYFIQTMDIIETLAKEGWPHRSVLGALGNSIVWQVAATIIAAMIQSENE